MAAPDADIQRLRRLVNETDNTVYSDALLASYLEAWPIIDSEGRSSNEDSWTEAYDLHAAAADIWEEKASLVAHKHDFSADGANFSSSQMYDMASEQARYHRARQKAKVKVVAKRPLEILSDLDEGYIANIDPLGEDDWQNLLELWND